MFTANFGTPNTNTYVGPNPTIDMNSQSGTSNPPALTAGQSQILNLTYLLFDNSTTSQVNGINQLNMNSPSGTPANINMNGGYIKNLTKSNFHGIKVTPPGTYQAVGTNASTTGPAVAASWCILSDVYTENDTGAPGVCQVVSNGTNWVVQTVTTANAPLTVCGMMCMEW